MFKIKNYVPPSKEDLLELRSKLGLTEDNLQNYLLLNNPQSLGRYIYGGKPLSLSFKNCFFLSANLSLTPGQFKLILDNMLEIGATFEVIEDEK